MIERTIEKITETETKIEKGIDHLEKQWNIKLKSEKITNLKKLKEHKKTIKKQMEIQKSERLKLIDKEIKEMNKETDKEIKKLENTCTNKQNKILTLIQKKLELKDKK